MTWFTGNGLHYSFTWVKVCYKYCGYYRFIFFLFNVDKLRKGIVDLFYMIIYFLGCMVRVDRCLTRRSKKNKKLLVRFH